MLGHHTAPVRNNLYCPLVSRPTSAPSTVAPEFNSRCQLISRSWIRSRASVADAPFGFRNGPGVGLQGHSAVLARPQSRQRLRASHQVGGVGLVLDEHGALDEHGVLAIGGGVVGVDNLARPRWRSGGPLDAPGGWMPVASTWGRPARFIF